MTDTQYDNVKNEIRDILISKAKLKQMITYTQLINELNSVPLEPHNPILFKLLGDISTEEVKNNRPMISVIVVHKSGDQQPGIGFFELAKLLGRDTSDILECWVKEFKKVFEYWSNV